eukprot:scaffold63929_cov17-Tisochrysis_lutea.AAC.2
MSDMCGRRLLTCNNNGGTGSYAMRICMEEHMCDGCVHANLDLDTPLSLCRGELCRRGTTYDTGPALFDLGFKPPVILLLHSKR